MTHDEGKKTKQVILQAALEVARSQGAAAVTIDAVVAKSGVSRGGVTHHYPKRSLLLLAVLDAAADRHRAALSIDTPLSSERERTQCYVTTTLDDKNNDRDALVLGLAEEPAVLEPWKRLNRELDEIERADPRVDEVAVFIRRLAIDGMWWSQKSDPSRFDAKKTERLLKSILNWTPCTAGRSLAQ